MKIEKLKIETHFSSNKKGLNKYKTNKTPNPRSIKFFKNLFKAKLEDRNRIKGISFSTNKREKNNFVLYKLKKKDEEIAFELSEANFLRTLRDYNQLKHEIYMKDLEERRIKNNEAIFNEKIIKRDINYSFIKETLYQFMRSKKSHNTYDTSLLKNKDEIKRAKKTKSNFINKTIKSVTRHFGSITGKIDMGSSRHEEVLSDKEYANLIEQISKSRLKHLKSYQGVNTNPNTDSSLINILEQKKSQNIIQKILPVPNYQDNNQEIDKKESDEDKFKENNKNNHSIKQE